MDREHFIVAMDEALQERNLYCKDLITGKVLRPLVITAVARRGFAALRRQEA